MWLTFTAQAQLKNVNKTSLKEHSKAIKQRTEQKAHVDSITMYISLAHQLVSNKNSLIDPIKMIVLNGWKQKIGGQLQISTNNLIYCLL